MMAGSLGTMKAILEFDLPDNQYEFHRAIYAVESWALLSNLDETLRRYLKYGCFEDGQKFNTPQELAEYLRAWLRDEVTDGGAPLELIF